ncbi:MAG: hypothetical protein AB7O96_11010 [Pseudobdellovibrionaceae bacterium]
MKKLIIGLSTTVLSLSASAMQVPEAWYDLKANEELLESGEYKAEGSPISFLNDMTRVMKVHTNSLSRASEVADRASKWELQQFGIKFGLTHEGRLGILPFNGTSSAEVILTKDKLRPVSSESSLSWDLDTNSRATSAEQIDYLTKLVMQSGQVKNEANVRVQATKIVTEVRKLQGLLTIDPASMWQVKRLFVDKTLTAEGQLASPFRVEGSVRLRVSWRPLATRVAVKGKTPEDDLIGTSFRKLVSDLGEDIHAIASANPIDGFELQTYQLGLGVMQSIGVGVASVGFEAWIHAEMEKNPKSTQAVVKSLPDDLFIWLIEDRAKKVDRNSIRKGLNYSFTIAKQLLRAANDANTKDWSVGEIRTTYDMAASGSFILSKILNGKGTTEMSFVRR